MKNILVTGAAGFIGANFAELMVKKYEGKYNIIVFDKLTYAGNLHNLDAIKDKIIRNIPKSFIIIPKLPPPFRGHSFCLKQWLPKKLFLL